jgi:hypothetical protein
VPHWRGRVLYIYLRGLLSAWCFIILRTVTYSLPILHVLMCYSYSDQHKTPVPPAVLGLMHPLFQASLLQSYLLQCRHRSDGLPAVVVGDTTESAGEAKTVLETSTLTLLSLGGKCPTKVEETAARCEEVAKMVRLFSLLSCSLMLPFLFLCMLVR